VPTEEQIREKLDGVLVPVVNRSLVKLNLVRQLNLSEGKVSISLAATALNPEAQSWLKDRVSEAIKDLPDVKTVETGFIDATANEVNEIGRIIAVMSGKGGVGKSLVASLSGVSLASRGFTVGILDADITGPSIPKMFGVTDRPAGSDTGIQPVLSATGIEIMSINLLLPNEDNPVIWRGPLIASAIKQFWETVLWGRLDYLIVDLPPGTADAPLTVMQSLPLAGVVIVFSPQELTAMVVKKAVQMSRTMNVPIVGVVENMSYLVLPDTGKRLEIFGRSRADEMVQAAEAPLLAQIPVDPELARLCDEGKIEGYDSEVIRAFGDALAQAVAVEVK